MLLKLAFAPFIVFIKSLISMLPEFPVSANITGFFGLLYTGLEFFPVDVWKFLLGHIFVWVTVFVVKAVINFVLAIFPTVSKF